MPKVSTAPGFLKIVFCLWAVGACVGQGAIQGITVNGKKVPHLMGQAIELKALDNDVVFWLRPASGPATRYEYRLVGFDQHWQSSPYPVARYTNLTGNEYQLLIRHRAQGKLSATAHIPVKVERELTEEVWFWPSVVLYGMLLLGAAVFFFLLYTFRQKLKIQAIRYRIAADLHDEVGATLSSIAISTRMAQKKMGDSRPDVHSLLSTIHADSEETIYTIRDTIWAINPDNDSLEKLFEKMRSFAAQVLAAQGIALDYDNQLVADPSLQLSMELRRNVYLMVKEAVNNLAKHSGATKAEMRISRTQEGLRVVVSDNGVGFDATADHEGNGLKNFRSRAQESFIALTIDSVPGRGTQLTMLVPTL